MPQVVLAPETGEDLDRVLQHLIEHDATNAVIRVQDIIRAIDVLESNPMIGRAERGDVRELVIGRRASGYVALYRYVAEVDTVFVLAIRGQKEAGYTRL